MLNGKEIKGIIFDYGGTLDTRGDHWSEVLWRCYQAEKVPITRLAFREAYVFGERALAHSPFISPSDDFSDLLFIKVHLQLTYLYLHHHVRSEDVLQYDRKIAERAFQTTRKVILESKEVLNKLSKMYKLVLVSNFYGNIGSVLKNFHLLCYFDKIIESAVVGVKKPDPAIFQLGVEALDLPADRVLVVGDSITKDILPAKSLGCTTAWIKGVEWKESSKEELLAPDITISRLTDLFRFLTNIENKQ
ncbi:MAG: HAD family hydrolase [Bacteroidaceae bacterium]|nr:HAD family hydrolase [Bacteroidaceae bacterium]